MHLHDVLACLEAVMTVDTMTTVTLALQQGTASSPSFIELLSTAAEAAAVDSGLRRHSLWSQRVQQHRRGHVARN